MNWLISVFYVKQCYLDILTWLRSCELSLISQLDIIIILNFYNVVIEIVLLREGGCFYLSRRPIKNMININIHVIFTESFHHKWIL